MSQHFLNKQEKEQRIIELHLQNKTIREIAKEVHMAFSPLSISLSLLYNHLKNNFILTK